MAIVVLYETRTGFTEKYAKWVSKTLGCKVMPLHKVNDATIEKANMIIFGGGIYAGKINGLKKMQKRFRKYPSKKLIVFATGAGPALEEEIERVKKKNIPQHKDIPFFYFRSGLNYEKMGWKDRTMMKWFVKMLKKQKNKSTIEQKSLEAMGKSYDVCKREAIKPLVDFVKQVN